MGQAFSADQSSRQTIHTSDPCDCDCKDKGTGTKGNKCLSCGDDGEEEDEHNHYYYSDLTLGLPEECLALVFGNLGCHDRNSCSLVCKRWRLVDSNSRQRIVLLARSEISPLLPTLLSRFSSVSALSLKCSRKLVSIDDDALSQIPVLVTYLKKLKLKGCIDISDDGLNAFSLHRPPLLTKLSFASCTGFGARGLISILSYCPSLQDLTLKRLRKLDAQNIPLSFEMKCQLPLKRLCLKDLHNARLFIPLLCSSKSLVTLIVCRSSGNWDRVLEESFHHQGRRTEYSKSTSLSEIQLENVQIGDAGLVAISASCPDLLVLHLSRVSDCTDDGLFAIANSCRKLRKLHIDAWSSRFGSSIRTIGDEGVLSLAASCTYLQEVVLMGVPVTLASLKILASNCMNLERLAICNAYSVGDLELVFIASKFLALKKLCIKNCPISDSGMEAVGEGCSNLEKLKVKRCRGVTIVSAHRLRMQRTSLVVSVDAEEAVVAEDNEIVTATEGIAGEGRRRVASVLPNKTSSRTDVLCSSRGVLLMRSKFENALQLGRTRPNPNESNSSSSRSSSSRVAATSRCIPK